MAGFVYLIRMGDTQYYKVGISNDNPQRRLADMQVSTPFVLELTEAYYQQKPLSLERDIHKALQYCHVRGEWFKDTDGDVVRLFREYNSMALFDAALKPQEQGERIKQPRGKEAVPRLTQCPKCGMELEGAKWLAACRWGHCASCKET